MTKMVRNDLRIQRLETIIYQFSFSFVLVSQTVLLRDQMAALVDSSIRAILNMAYQWIDTRSISTHLKPLLGISLTQVILYKNNSRSCKERIFDDNVEARHDKPCLPIFLVRSGPTQTGLYNHRRGQEHRLESFSK